jgi:hypothetical protein
VRDREGRIKREPRMGCSPCLVVPTEIRESGGKAEMRQRIVSISVDSTTQPRDCLLVAAEKELGEPCCRYPRIGIRVVRTKAERFIDVSLVFLSATV